VTASTVVSPADLLQTPAGFHLWLNTQNATEIVGVAESLYHCPIANYLGSQGVQGVAVGHNTVRWDVAEDRPWESPRHPLPDWAVLFVAAVDSDGRPVSAAHARTLLYQAEKAAAA
jgi:hypothetical protein